MEFLASRAGVILAALILDRLLGDPRRLPHPVRLIGRLIASGESLRRLPLPARWSGTLLALGVITAAGGTAWLLVNLGRTAGLWWGLGVETLLVYLAVAPCSLAGEALAVDAALQHGNLPGARRRLAMIVGRDTAGLDEREVRRAVVETVGENTVDAVLCPVFYALLFGPVGAWVYKAVSTLDSMIGYRHEPYRDFGRAAARLDDLAAFVPARLALFFVPTAALLSGLSARDAWRVGWRDRLAHPSPNAGHGEALFAGALKVRLGGPSTYHGMPSEKPYLGAEFPAPGRSAVRRAVTLLWATTWLFAVAGSAVLVFLGLF
ncbi:MAG: adenosylcobinamide-phosphate synthase CbiB [Thermoanaerobacterales bacterium]|nr:adenosylcobinamide-phosphate synthase CbiB [Bacillota bacterium]MDI6906969.1 adenosylcobinamide-phosphate synthase CbiB [Thermoanaerobacterales bacterium]